MLARPLQKGTHRPRSSGTYPEIRAATKINLPLRLAEQFPVMKSLLLAAALSSAALTGSALAYSPKDAAAPTPRLVPSSVVKPTGLPLNFAGATINIEFSLDAGGQPQNIKVLWVDDAVLKRRLVEAFRQWRFDTGANAKAAGDKRFILPVELRPEV